MSNGNPEATSEHSALPVTADSAFATLRRTLGVKVPRQLARCTEARKGIRRLGRRG